MRHAYLCTALLGLLLVASCGGGSSSSTTSSSSSGSGSHNFSGGGSNVVAISVGNGPGGVAAAFNIPYTSVTVCIPNGGACATIDDVLVDTGSSGLRLIASVLTHNGLTLTPMADPGNAADSIVECLPFADGYTWGAVASATVKIGGESAAAVSVQVIDDSDPPSPAAPASCTNNGSPLNSVAAFDANGVLGVGLFAQDCGSYCAQAASNDVYWSCTPAGSCTSTTLASADQVTNPVADFGTDNNGVIVQLPGVGVNGAAGASGYLVFGIATESNNGLNGATVLTADGEGNFTTTFNDQALGSSFIDSGSNALFFPDNSMALCGQSGGAADFYCPSSTLSLSATNEGANGTMSSVSFQVVDLNEVSGSNFALDDAAGPAGNIDGVGQTYFDWGLPFFYGNTVFIAIEGSPAGGQTGPYYAY